MAKTLLKSLPCQVGFRSVVVITLASHARGPGFETQRKQGFSRQSIVINCPVAHVHRIQGVPERLHLVERTFAPRKTDQWAVAPLIDWTDLTPICHLY